MLTFKLQASEYLEGIGTLQGKLSHILDVLHNCFHGSDDQVNKVINFCSVISFSLFYKASRLEYGVRGLALALCIYGPSSTEVFVHKSSFSS